MRRPGRAMKLGARVLRSEGLVAFRDRVVDRALETYYRMSFHELGKEHVAVPILNVLASPPETRWGGVPAQFLNRMEEESRERPFALLYPTRDGYRLDVRQNEHRHFLNAKKLAQLSEVTLRDEAFETAVESAARRVGAKALHFEGLAGWPLSSLLNLRSAGFRLILSLHDFSLFCPRPNLIEHPSLKFCDYSTDLPRCATCLAASWALPIDYQSERRKLAASLLSSADALIFPSEFLRQKHADLFPGVVSAKGAAVRRVIIEPAVRLAVHSGQAVGAKAEPPCHVPNPLQRIALVGAVKPHKGALVFEDVVSMLGSSKDPGPSSLSWYVYGSGDSEILLRLRRLSRLKVRGYYRAGALPGLLAKDRIDLALILSIVPESYSQTLTECWAAGVPVLAFDLGAIGQRIAERGGGFLVALDKGASGIAEALSDIAAGRLSPSAPVSSGSGSQGPADSPGPHDARAAATAHLNLYRDLGLLSQ